MTYQPETDPVKNPELLGYVELPIRWDDSGARFDALVLESSIGFVSKCPKSQSNCLMWTRDLPRRVTVLLPRDEVVALIDRARNAKARHDIARNKFFGG